MAIKVLNSVHEKIVGKTNYIRAEIIVDSVAELPTEINGSVLSMGSIAWNISTGDFYGLDSSGTWRNQNGEDTSQSNVSASTLSASPDRGEIKSINIQPDIAKANIDDSEKPESMSEIDIPEKSEDIPDSEPLEKEVKKDAVRDFESF